MTPADIGPSLRMARPLAIFVYAVVEGRSNEDLQRQGDGFQQPYMIDHLHYIISINHLHYILFKRLSGGHEVADIEFIVGSGW